jgi:hypothetical protein
VGRRKGALEARDHISVTDQGCARPVTKLGFFGSSGRYRAHVAGGHQRLRGRARLDRVEREPQSRRAAAERAAEIGRQHRRREISHGG